MRVTRAWTPNECSDLVEAYGAGKPIADIAAGLGRTPGSVTGKLHILGVPPRDFIRWTDDQIATLRREWESNPSLRAISAMFPRRSGDSIQLKASELGLSRYKVRRNTVERSKPLEIPPLRAAWLAGFLDGEGTIGLYRNSPKSFHVRLSVVNSHAGSIELVKSMIGGGITSRVRKNPKHKDCYVWQSNDTGLVLGVLRKIEPYLVIKREQALLIIRYIEEWLECQRWETPICAEATFARMRQLNARGAQTAA